jgi:anti-sigma-K factor RskA
MDLAHPDRRARLDELAAQYALGTLRGPARDAFTRAAHADPQIAAVAREWERRLASSRRPCLGSTRRLGCGPPSRHRLGLEGVRGAGLAWWQRLGFWRGFALASFAAALVLSAVQLMQPPAAPGESLVAVLTGPDAKPVMVATAALDQPILTLKAVAEVTPGPGRAFELWALPEGSPPQSLGVIAPAGVVKVRLRGPSGDALARVRPWPSASSPPAAPPPASRRPGALFRQDRAVVLSACGVRARVRRVALGSA